MLSILSRKKCRQLLLGFKKYAGNFESGKIIANVGSEQNGKFGPEKNASKFGPKKMAFLGGKKIANCRQTCRSVKKLSTKNAFAKLCTGSNSARIFCFFFFFSGFVLNIRRKLPALPISGKVASLLHTCP